MEFVFLHSPIFLFIIVPLSALAALWMYWRTSYQLPVLPKILLGIFRFVVLVVLGVLLLEPLLNYQQRISSPPIVAVLQDVSESLVIQKDSQFVKETYPKLLDEWVASVDEQSYSVDVWGYASQLQTIDHPDSLNFTNEGTNISLAFSELQKRYQNQNLGAIVLASDGISTAGANPLYASEGFRQPVFTVLLGDTTQQRDVQIQDVSFNEIAYLKTEMPIRVKINMVGYSSRELTVSLSKENEVLEQKTLTLGNTVSNGEVDFYLQPDETGLQQYTLSVTRLNEEVSYRNNTQKIFINVLETRRRIALLAGASHPDIGALKRTFEQDESYELEPFIIKDSGTFYENPENYNWEDFDLFILHNFPESNRDEAIVNKLVDVIKEKEMPVMYFVGKATDLRVMEPLFEYMALTPTEVKLRSEEIIPNFLSTYQQHSTFTFERSWLQWASNSPPIFHNRSTWQPKNTAEVFATAKIKNVELDYPVFALQSYLGKKNMVFVGENFWRIRTHSYLERESFEAFDDWVINNVKWLTVTDDKRKFKVEPIKNVFTGSEPVILKGQVYDDSYNPISGVEIKVDLTSPNGNRNEYYLNEITPAQYSLELYNLEEGTFSYDAEGIKDDREVGTDKGTFSIGKSNIEHFELQADLDLMQQIALRTGGEFLYGREIKDLSEKLANLPGLKPTVDFSTQRQSVIDFPWLLGILLGLLAVEWIARKWNSLL